MFPRLVPAVSALYSFISPSQVVYAVVEPLSVVYMVYCVIPPSVTHVERLHNYLVSLKSHLVSVCICEHTGNIVFISVFLIIADWIYFYALTFPGSMISIVSMVRRSNVLVTFLAGALFFHEKNLKSKAIDLFLVLLGMIFLYLGTR